MLDEIAVKAVLDQILRNGAIIVEEDGTIDRLLVDFFAEAFTESFVMVEVGMIDEADGFMLDAALRKEPKFDT